MTAILAPRAPLPLSLRASVIVLLGLALFWSSLGVLAIFGPDEIDGIPVNRDSAPWLWIAYFLPLVASLAGVARRHFWSYALAVAFLTLLAGSMIGQRLPMWWRAGNVTPVSDAAWVAAHALALALLLSPSSIRAVTGSAPWNPIR